MTAPRVIDRDELGEIWFGPDMWVPDATADCGCGQPAARHDRSLLPVAQWLAAFRANVLPCLDGPCENYAAAASR